MFVTQSVAHGCGSSGSFPRVYVDSSSVLQPSRASRQHSMRATASLPSFSEPQSTMPWLRLLCDPCLQRGQTWRAHTGLGLSQQICLCTASSLTMILTKDDTGVFEISRQLMQLQPCHGSTAAYTSSNFDDLAEGCASELASVVLSRHLNGLH